MWRCVYANEALCARVDSVRGAVAISRIDTDRRRRVAPPPRRRTAAAALPARRDYIFHLLTSALLTWTHSEIYVPVTDALELDVSSLCMVPDNIDWA